MLTVFLYSFMCYGLCAALVYYSGPWNILDKFRGLVASNSYLNELFSCMFCLPTNVGFIMSVISLLFASGVPFTPFTLLLKGHEGLWPMIVLFDGFYTGAVVSIIDTVVERLNIGNQKVMS